MSDLTPQTSAIALRWLREVPARDEVIRIDAEGFHYLGQFIADAGEAYQLLVEFLRKQRQALVPVSVHERPWEREGWCDAEGKCWWGRGESDDWSADWTLATPEAVAEFCEFSPQTVCLPAHALPLPEGSND